MACASASEAGYLWLVFAEHFGFEPIQRVSLKELELWSSVTTTKY